MKNKEGPKMHNNTCIDNLTFLKINLKGFLGLISAMHFLDTIFQFL